MKKISQMLIDVSGDFITGETEEEEVSVRADITVTAWNIAILPKHKRNPALNKYIRKVSKYAPSQDAADSLKEEMAKIIRCKVKKYPSVRIKVDKIEIIKREKEYIIRVFHHGNESLYSDFSSR